MVPAAQLAPHHMTSTGLPRPSTAGGAGMMGLDQWAMTPRAASPSGGRVLTSRETPSQLHLPPQWDRVGSPAMGMYPSTAAGHHQRPFTAGRMTRKVDTPWVTRRDLVPRAPRVPKDAHHRQPCSPTRSEEMVGVSELPKLLKDDRIPVGAMIELRGMTKNPHHNGKQGYLTAHGATGSLQEGKYIVKLCTGETLCLAPEQVKLVALPVCCAVAPHMCDQQTDLYACVAYAAPSLAAEDKTAGPGECARGATARRGGPRRPGDKRATESLHKVTQM